MGDRPLICILLIIKLHYMLLRVWSGFASAAPWSGWMPEVGREQGEFWEHLQASPEVMYGRERMLRREDDVYL